MLRYHKFASVLAVLSVAASLSGAPKKATEGRSRAIDLLAEGQALEQSGDNQGAYQKYYESVQTAASPSGYYHLGRIARLTGQTDAARQYLDQALQLSPNFELAKVELLQLKEGSTAKQGAVVSTISGEMSGDVRPGAAESLAGPMNVDALRREVVTMQSLAPPVVRGNSGEPATVSSADTEVPETPADIVLTDGAGNEVKPVDGAPSILSPTIDPSTANDVLPSLSADASGSSKKSDLPTSAELNDAAFGEESQKDPGSKGYGQTTKVALGTFAFHREKGDDYRKANRFAEAAVEYKTALELSPNDTETRTLLAEMYGRIGQGDKAGTQFEKAKAQAPADDRIYYKEGNTYFDEQKYDLAIGSYRKAVELNPRNKLALNNMGVAYMEKKDYAVAAEKFKQVVELDPKYDMAVLNLGIIYDEHIIDKAQALKYYDQYLALNGPRSTEVQRWADAIRAKQPN